MLTTKPCQLMERLMGVLMGVEDKITRQRLEGTWIKEIIWMYLHYISLKLIL